MLSIVAACDDAGGQTADKRLVINKLELTQRSRDELTLG